MCVWKDAYNREMPEWLYAFLPGCAEMHSPQPVAKGQTGRHTRLECRRAGGKA